MKSILLIHPPVAKPGEPPAGVAKLAWALRARGVDCRVYDANIDGILGLLAQPLAAGDTWTRRALANRQANISALRSRPLYLHPDRYKRAVVDTNRVLAMAGKPYNATLSLANSTTPSLSPVRSQDLIQSAEQFATNPFYEIFAKKLLQLFDQQAPDVVGISINFMSQALGAFAMIGFIRKHLPRATIVCGGGLVSSWTAIPDLDNPFAGLIDELVSGPGEGRLAALCTGGQAMQTAVTGYDYTFEDPDRYLSAMRVLPYATSRGCYWRKCAFCPEKSENHPYLFGRPPAIIDDLKQTAQRHQAGLIHFLDNALSPRMLGHLSDHPPGMPWYGFARVTHHLTDPAFVQGLKQSGCVLLKLGVESGDQRVLDALAKGIDITMVSRALATCHQAGIATYVYLLFGTPAEDEQSACQTLEFTLAHAASIDFLNLAIFNLPAYSPEARQLETMDFYAGDLSLYREFVHPRGWDRNRVRQFLAKTFKKPPAVRRILNNDPPFFTSNHAPFFHLSNS